MSENGRYILEGHTPVLESNLTKWAKWFETATRIVVKTDVGEMRVSTVFLGRDYSFGDGPPLLFETMVFGGDLDGEMDRYSTWDEAVAGHEKMVERCKP